ncbi:hypothetical protein AVEN_189016-1 [Araneus ventricosus]|uniref:Uncharacterized protein n=1 Tax=Araneus ventricosus TaxID=182803 RepID=A0A4Y2QJ23_ARAVE|nr:hypothetical protein AVEN_189016-1 [Araneus ventricosus]
MLGLDSAQRKTEAANIYAHSNHKLPLPKRSLFYNRLRFLVSSPDSSVFSHSGPWGVIFEKIGIILYQLPKEAKLSLLTSTSKKLLSLQLDSKSIE